MLHLKKRETFEEGKELKAQIDELKKQMLLRAEQESSKATKGNIKDEWSKIEEKFDRILKNIWVRLLRKMHFISIM